MNKNIPKMRAAYPINGLIELSKRWSYSRQVESNDQLRQI